MARTEILTIRISQDLREKLEIVARRENMTVSTLARTVLEEYVSKYKNGRKLK